MVYIPEGLRKYVDYQIEALINSIETEVAQDKRNMVIAYALSRVLLGSIRPVEDYDFKSLCDAFSILEVVKLELSNRFGNNYMGRMKQKNGDVPEYISLDTYIDQKFGIHSP